MLNVLLLGDSIRLYYQEKVKMLLGDQFVVYAPEENCKFSTLTLNSLHSWLREFPTPQIIHWNNGLWDTARVYPEDGCFTQIELYKSNLLKILRELKKTGAKIIFATTTPTDPKKAELHEGMSVHYNEDIVKYNDVACAIMKENNVLIDDLYSVINGNQAKYIRQDDLIHPTEAGINVLAAQVAKKIKQTSEEQN